MANTKEFFLTVTQRLFSNWTALKVIVYFYNRLLHLLIMNYRF